MITQAFIDMVLHVAQGIDTNAERRVVEDVVNLELRAQALQRLSEDVDIDLVLNKADAVAQLALSMKGGQSRTQLQEWTAYRASSLRERAELLRRKRDIERGIRSLSRARQPGTAYKLTIATRALETIADDESDAVQCAVHTLEVIRATTQG